MTELPLWAAVSAALLLVLAGIVTLVGSLGLLRLRSFHERMHAPTMGMTMGAFCVVLAATLIASLLQHRPIVHEWLICLFLFMTAPVTAILLMQSARHRQRTHMHTPGTADQSSHTESRENPYTDDRLAHTGSGHPVHDARP